MHACELDGGRLWSAGKIKVDFDLASTNSTSPYIMQYKQVIYWW